MRYGWWLAGLAVDGWWLAGLAGQMLAKGWLVGLDGWLAGLAVAGNARPDRLARLAGKGWANAGKRLAGGAGWHGWLVKAGW
jgi:hypothetical protein